MNKYTFEQMMTCTTTIEAETPEQAIEIWKNSDIRIEPFASQSIGEKKISLIKGQTQFIKAFDLNWDDTVAGYDDKNNEIYNN